MKETNYKQVSRWRHPLNYKILNNGSVLGIGAQGLTINQVL